jgi:hypothetical protein
VPGGIPETTRVVVPSDAAIRQSVAKIVTGLNALMGVGALPGPEVASKKAIAQGSFRADVQYIDDQLHAASRMGGDAKLLFDVVGVELVPHVLLGGAMRLPGTTNWLQLFPVALAQMLLVLPGYRMAQSNPDLLGHSS